MTGSGEQREISSVRNGAGILVVEDDPQIAELIELILVRHGYMVLGRVDSGEAALLEAERLKPQLILMDVELSGLIDGVEAAARIRHRHNIPVIFLTGLIDEGTLARSRASEPFGYLTKPIRQEELVSSIAIALHKWEHERKLRKIEQWFFAAIKSIGEGVITTDAEENVLFLNPIAEGLTGKQSQQVLGSKLAAVFKIADSDSAEVFPDPLRELLEPRPTARQDRYYLLEGTGNAYHPIEATAASIRSDEGTLVGFVLIFRDIAPRIEHQTALHRSREELRRLAAHLQSVREDERTRIAREIHDELGQLLTGLKIDLAWIENRLAERIGPGAQSRLLAKVKTMSKLLRDIVTSVRRIATELRPAVLDNLGLITALEWQAREFETRTGIPCQLAVQVGRTDFSRDLCTTVFRIFQESLTNVARHAAASQVHVRLQETNGTLQLRVQDNGRGIRENELAGAHSFGLMGMRERALLCSGQLAITGEAGRGTAVTLTVPLEAGSRENYDQSPHSG